MENTIFFFNVKFVTDIKYYLMEPIDISITKARQITERTFLLGINELRKYSDANH